MFSTGWLRCSGPASVGLVRRPIERSLRWRMRKLPKRRNSIRCPTHDYRGNGFYLITMTVLGWHRILGHVAQRQLHPSPLGQCVLDQLEQIHHWSPVARANTIALMPNHLHIILAIRGASWESERRTGAGPVAHSVSTIIGQVKSRATTAAIKAGLWRRGEQLWLRSFHDRRLPDLRAVKAARRYLELNPLRWEQKYGTGRPPAGLSPAGGF